VTDEAKVIELTEQLLAEYPPATTDPVTFLGAQFDLGLAWIHFDEGFGGLGLARSLMRPVLERLQAAGAPSAGQRNPIGAGMAAPTIATWGTDEQKKRYLRPLFTGEEVWCQLFSEPGAGSDVAALATSAVPDGDDWVVNGQKVWTTLAHLASFGILVARTDPNLPKHSGLSYFIVDMHAPGVEVRPLRQITGEAEFNEVFFSDARIPNANILGNVGDGWRVSLTTLMNERDSIGGGVGPRGSGAIGMAVKLWSNRAQDQRDPATKDELMKLYVRAEATRLTNMRAAANAQRGTPGPEGSVGKLAFAENNKDIYSFCVDLLGAQGMLHDSYAFVRPERTMDIATPTKAFLRARANSIEGGTTEVMKNILGERVLGLPGDVRVDKGIAWKEVPRN
jgi:alkylation response protein AidB-like acyl-CoA dehydrogenase